MEKRFQKNDSGFICASCGKEVLPLGYTSRNHCPFCLCSLHLDINPGDRASDCGGLLEPVSALPDPKKGYIIISKCRKCGEIRRNKSAHEASVQPDDINKIIALTVNKNWWFFNVISFSFFESKERKRNEAKKKKETYSWAFIATLNNFHFRGVRIEIL